MAISFKYKIFLAFLFITGFMWIGSNHTMAANAEWPGDSWGAGTDMNIRLSQNKNHPSAKGTSMKFYYWSKSPGNHSVNIVKTKCGAKQNSYANVSHGGYSQRFESINGGCGNKTVALTSNRQVPIGNTTYYQYAVDVQLYRSSGTDDPWVGDEIAFFQFRVEYDDANGTKVGFKSDSSSSLPIISSKGENMYLPNINIPIGSCKANPGGLQHFNVYDSDNNPNLYAQPTPYKDVRYKVTNNTGVRNPDNWENNGGGDLERLFWPRDTNSSTSRYIEYGIPTSLEGKNATQRPHLRIVDLGGGNYTVLGIPFDELPFDCPSRDTDILPDIGSQVKCDTPWINGNVDCRVDRQTYPGTGGNPLVQFQHHFKGGSQPDIDKYDVDINARCPLNPGLSGGGHNGLPIDTDCEKYSFIWLDADPWHEDKNTHWDYNFPPGGPYCEQMSWKAYINPPGEDNNYWTGVSTGNTPCATVTQWALSASTWASANGAGVADNSTVYSNQSIYFGHRVWNSGSAALDQFLDVNVYGDKYGSDYTSLDQYRDWGVGSYTDSLNQISSPGRHCQWIWAAQTLYNNSAANFPGLCVYVVDPDSTVPSAIQYEKGSGGLAVGGRITVDNGGDCPVNLVKIPYTVTIDGVKVVDTTFDYGGGAGCGTPPKDLISISPTLAIKLDNLAPGESNIEYCISVNGEVPDCGKIIVVEVPFARFYGNDVYATSGDIKFNSYTNNNPNNTSGNYNGQGTVAQYAALATGTSVIDTAAFRLNAAIQPIAPNGLDPNGSYLSNTSASKVYNEVVSKIPTNCGTTPSSYLLPTSSGCYRVSDDYRLTGIPRIGGSDGITCLDKQRINPLHTCGFPNNFEYITSNYDKKITLYNPDPNKPFMIVGDIVNTSASYSNPSSTGVMLIVSAGDIIIDNNVKRVDAILISNKGIYTCGWTWAPGYGSKVGQNQIDETCRSNLTINGSLSAKTIDFRRVGGSRYLSNGLGDTIDGSWNCLAWKGIKNCGDRGDMPLDTGKTAEIVNFPAYLYWATPYLLDQAKSGGTNEAMFVAPPRL